MGKIRSKISFSCVQFKALFDKMLEEYIGKIDYSKIEENRTAFIGKTVSIDKKKDKSMIESIVLSKKTEKVINDFFLEEYQNSIHINHISIKKYAIMNRGRNNLFINPKYLYTYFGIFLEQNGNPKNIENKSIQSPYHELFFAYAGIEDPTTFLIENNTKKNNEASDINGVLEQKKVQFDAYYYSYFSYTIKTFRLDIVLSDKVYTINLDSFHEDPRDNHTYSGRANIIGGKLQGTLEKLDPSSKDTVYIIINSGLNPFESKEMLGSLMTVSAKSTKAIINLEFYLVDKTLENENSKELDFIKRYLIMHRYNFRIPVKSPKAQSLTARGTKVDYIDHLVDTFRVWRFDSKYKNIVQSVLYIGKDYKVSCLTTIYESKNFNNQICLLHKNYYNNNILSMSSHPNDTTGVIGYMMINMTPSDKEGHVFSGTFVSISDSKYHAPINRSIVLRREPFDLIRLEDSNELEFSNAELMNDSLKPISISNLENLEKEFLQMKNLLLDLEEKDKFPSNFLKE